MPRDLILSRRCSSGSRLVPDAESEVQRFNEAMFVIRRESAPGGLYHDRPWLAEEAEQRARVILAKAGVPEPKPETPQRYTADPVVASQVDPQGVVHELQSGVVILRTHGADPPVEYRGEHKNPAIARVIAALRARFDL
jgi:hypothetical protein